MNQRSIFGVEGEPQAVERRVAPVESEADLIRRLQEDRAILVEALRCIRREAPVKEPERRPGAVFSSETEAERYGYQTASWERGEKARRALDAVGASS